ANFQRELIQQEQLVGTPDLRYRLDEGPKQYIRLVAHWTGTGKPVIRSADGRELSHCGRLCRTNQHVGDVPSGRLEIDAKVNAQFRIPLRNTLLAYGTLRPKYTRVRLVRSESDRSSS